METNTQNSQLTQISVGGAGAPNHFTFETMCGQLAFSSGDVLDGLSIGGVHKGGGGGNSAELTLKAGEYYNGFELAANMEYYGGVVIAGKFTTNLGRSVEFNANELPGSGNPPASVVVTNCRVLSIDVIYGSFINQMTLHYISDYAS